jgi:hypothetical protein
MGQRSIDFDRNAAREEAGLSVWLVAGLLPLARMDSDVDLVATLPVLMEAFVLLDPPTSS